jgi:misacylated tRNA(Ala) deacylase
MSRYLCHTEPDRFEFEAHVIARSSNAVLLDRVEMDGGNAWHLDTGLLPRPIRDGCF